MGRRGVQDLEGHPRHGQRRGLGLPNTGQQGRQAVVPGGRSKQGIDRSGSEREGPAGLIDHQSQPAIPPTGLVPLGEQSEMQPGPGLDSDGIRCE